MLTPSIGLLRDAVDHRRRWMPAASRIVGTMSMTWWNCVRMPPASLMRAGQAITIPCRVPPKCEATCLVHLNGVSNAHAQPTGMCGVGRAAEPQMS